MNKNILNIEIQEFINNNINSNTDDLLLKKSKDPSLDFKTIVEQIEAKKRCQKKLPTWFSTEQIYYPNKLNIEQTSSEITAAHKSKLIKGKSIVDISGGFGVDCYYFSKVFDHVIHCEIDESLSNIVNHNYKSLNVTNIECIAKDGLQFLTNTQKKFDCIYVDPSRRHDSKGKVFFLEDCSPNIPKNLELLFKYSKTILIKTSPLLDLSVGISELKNIKQIHIVAVNNEVKELLWVLEKKFEGNLKIKTINLKNGTQEIFDFKLGEESYAHATYSKPLSYLYEPNAAILKSGAFNLVSQKLNVFKFHKHSHLYTSDSLLNFPGRSFKIIKVLPYNKKQIKQEDIKKANITTRNFPETVSQIRKRFNIKDGGKDYLFFTTIFENNQKVVIFCKKEN